MPIDITGSKTADDAQDYVSRKAAFLNATDAQIDAYIQSKVTDLASARLYLKELTKVVRTLARRMQ